jgi:undecaprenyl-diphosphatase
MRAINEWPEWMAPAMRFFSVATDYLWVKLALLLMLAGMIYRRGAARRAAVQALVAFPIANGLTDLFKKNMPQPRPCQVIDLIERVGCSESAGTASAHSANMAAVAAVFTWHLGWWGAPWIVIAVLTGVSRTYNGVHYPHQVLLGWTVGAFAAITVCLLWDLIVRKRTAVSVEKTEDVEKSE